MMSIDFAVELLPGAQLHSTLAAMREQNPVAPVLL